MTVKFLMQIAGVCAGIVGVSYLIVTAPPPPKRDIPSPIVAPMTTMEEAQLMVDLRGRPCGAVRSALRGDQGMVVFTCTNGLTYGIGHDGAGGSFLVQRNDATGQFENR